MDNLGKTLIFIHAGFGGAALVSGAISIIAKKGTAIHKKAGKLFFYTMLFSTTLSLIIASLPNHKSTFLFCIGVFSSYFIIGGFRSLRFNQRGVSLYVDKFLAYLVILTGTAMIFYPSIFHHEIDVVLLVFGIIAWSFGFSDLLLFKTTNRVKENWLKIHLSKMISGYVAAVTAFVVVNGWLPGVWAWLTPSIFGNFYLVYWLVKLRKKPMVKS